MREYYNAYQVTGDLQIDYVNYFCPDNQYAPHIILPNLIDNKVFCPNGSKADLRKYGIGNDKLICVLPHRILDYKIPMEFIRSTAKSYRTHYVIIGQGDKDYEQIVKAEIAHSNLPITIIPFAQQHELASIYRAADYFCLPSKTDASPLTPIEAIATGLPIIVSDRIGNRSDVLEENINGFSFDPYSERSCYEAISKIEALQTEDLNKMRESSLARYNARFDNETCLRQYAKGIKKIILQKRTELCR